MGYNSFYNKFIKRWLGFILAIILILLLWPFYFIIAAAVAIEDGFPVFIPQLGGHCSVMPISGIWTFCLHPTAMKDAQFKAVEDFLKVHKDEFIGFDELDLTNLKGKSMMGKLLSWAYFTMRKIRGRR